MPTQSHTELKTEAGPTAVAMWEWTSVDGATYFAVGYSQYPHGAMAGVNPREALDQGRDLALKGVNAKPTSSKALTIEVGGQKVPGLEFEGTTILRQKTSMRMFLVADRLYQLIDVRPVTDPRDADFQRFTQAFELKQVNPQPGPGQKLGVATPENVADGGAVAPVTGHPTPSPRKTKL